MVNFSPQVAAAEPILRDVHFPPPLSFWPPATWVVVISSLLLLVATGVCTLRWYYRRQYALWRLLQNELSQLQQEWQSARNQEQVYLDQLAVLVRRAVLSQYPSQNIATLFGKTWLQFLDRLTDTELFCHGSGQVFGMAIYQSNASSQISDQLFVDLKKWLDCLLLPKPFKGIAKRLQAWRSRKNI